MKMKRYPTEWEKIVYLYKGLISRICKKTFTVQHEKPVLKWTKDLNRFFSKEDIQMG